MKDNSLNLIGANFWLDSIRFVHVGTDSNYLESNKKASIMVLDILDHTVSVFDPTMLNTSTIDIALKRTASSVVTSDPAITVTQMGPFIKLSVNANGLERRTVTVVLSKAEGTEELSRSALSFSGLKVEQGIKLVWNKSNLKIRSYRLSRSEEGKECPLYKRVYT